jgi:hypothetical protein
MAVDPPARLLRSPAFWLLSLLYGIALSLPWLPPRAEKPSPYLLEVEITVGHPGAAQVYVDVGRDLNEHDSTSAVVPTADERARIRLPLPAKEIRVLRFDPFSGPGRCVIHQARILGERGRLRLAIAPTDWLSQHQIAAFEPRGTELRLEAESDANDPSISLNLPAPLVLEPVREMLPLQAFVPIAGFTVGSALLLLGVAWMWPRLQARAPVLTPRPRLLLLVAAFAGLLANSYPVIFLGRSFVAPNYGARLLYDDALTLPGQTDPRQEDVSGSDVGAIAWAHVPMSFVQAEALRAGELPLWNRYNSTGVALLGQGQAMIGDPLQFLVIAAGADAWAWDLKYLLAKGLFGFAFGLLAWRLSGHLGFGALTAATAGFIGFFLYRVNHPAFFTFSYSPWILVAWLGVLRAERSGPLFGALAGLVGANLWVMTSGTVKEAYMLILGINAIGAALLLASTHPWSWRRQRLGLTLLAGVAFAGLSAPLWLTLLETLRTSYSGYNAPSAYQTHLSFLVGLFDEIFHRPIQAGERMSNPSGSFLVLGGLLGLAATWRRLPCSREVRVLVLAFAAAVAMAFGVIPPQWIERVPFLGNVAHIDNCFSLLALVAAIPLAAEGWRRMWIRLREPEGASDIRIVAVLLLALLAPWIATLHTVHKPLWGPANVYSPHAWGERLPVSAFGWASAIVLPGALLAGLVVARNALSRGRWTILHASAVGLCLILLLWRHGQQVPSQFDPYVFSPAGRTSFFGPSRAIDALRADQREPGRVLAIEGVFVSGWSPAYRLEGISGPDALVNPRYRELNDALGIEYLWDWRIVARAEAFAAQRRAFDFLGVRHYLQHPEPTEPWSEFLTVVTRADLNVYRSELTWPRAFFTPALEAYGSPKELAARITGGTGAPFAAVLPEDRRPEWPVARTPAATVAARDYTLGTTATAFTLEAPDAGFAVLHEAWVPEAFRVTLNGRPAEVIRINHAFKGVRLPAAGEWRVVFTYRPSTFGVATAISGATVGALLLGGTLLLLRRRRPA